MTRGLSLLLVLAGVTAAPSLSASRAENGACAAIARAVVQRMGPGATVSACEAAETPGEWTGAVPDSAARVGQWSWFTLSGVRTTARVRALVEVQAAHAIAVQTLTRGRIVAAGDVAADAGVMTGARFERVPVAADLTGARVARVIEAGFVVQALDVVKPFLVKPGEQVIAIVRIGAVEVTAAMTAVDGGSIGDVIRMSARDRNRVLRGTVIGPGRVEVAHEK